MSTYEVHHHPLARTLHPITSDRTTPLVAALAMAVPTAPVDAVRRHVSDRKVLDAIGREVERLVAIDGNVLEPPR